MVEYVPKTFNPAQHGVRLVLVSACQARLRNAIQTVSEPYPDYKFSILLLFLFLRPHGRRALMLDENDKSLCISNALCRGNTACMNSQTHRRLSEGLGKTLFVPKTIRTSTPASKGRC